MTYLTVRLGRIIDKYVFSPLCFLLGLFSKKRQLDKKNVKRILVIKLWALGDSIVLLPLLDALRKVYPKAKIDILSHKQNRIIFENRKSISNIVNFGILNILKMKKDYDLCIDTEPALSVSGFVAFIMSKYRIGFSHGIRSRLYNETVKFSKKQHMVQNYLDFARKLGVKYNTDSLVPVVVSKADKKLVENYLKKKDIKENDFLVGISPGVAESVKYRMWPMERFAELADELVIRKNAKIVFIDSKGNRKLINKIQKLMKEESINAAGELNIKQSAELMRKCSIFISNDSGPMHMAAAMGTKTIGLFGPNTPKLWGPYGKHNISIWKPKQGCPYIDNTKRELIPAKLTKNQLTCMDAISVDDVLNAAEKIK